MDDTEISFQRCPHDRKNPYVMISRAMFQDKSISPKAKGVLGFLLSLPSDWKIYHSNIQEQLNIGEDYLNSAIEELLQAGYAERSRERLNGRFQPYKYTIWEFKKCLPKEENPVGFSGAAKPDILNRETYIQNKQQQKESPSAPAAALLLDKEKQEALKQIDIPQEEKTYLCQTYTAECLRNAIAWATDSRNPPTKSLVASIKFACKNGLSLQNLGPSIKKPKTEAPCDGANRTCWGSISNAFRQMGKKIESYGIREGAEYLEMQNDKVYFKDNSFLERLESYLRKKDVWQGRFITFWQDVRNEYVALRS